jgi:hypothetical protein
MNEISPGRRRFLATTGLALALPSVPTGAAMPSRCETGDDLRRPKHRIALLLGNSSYPGKDQDLFASEVNLASMSALLRDGFDFEVSAGENFGLEDSRRLIDRFLARAATIQSTSGFVDGDLCTLIYFSGHGLQRKGINYLVPANVDQLDVRIEEKSISLQNDILRPLRPLSPAYPGLNLVLLDACRTGGELGQSLAQFTSVQGCLVTVGSSSGAFAFFPKERGKHSYFTQAILDVFQEERQNPMRATPVERLMTLVELRTAEISKRELLDKVNASLLAKGFEPAEPQRAETTKNLRDPSFVLQNEASTCEALQRIRSEVQLTARAKEKERFDAISSLIYPRQVLKACAEFIRDFGASDYRPSVLARQYEAEKTIKALAAVPSLSAETLVTPDPNGDRIYRQDLRKASVEGDKDASQRIAWMYRDGTNGLSVNRLRQQDFLRLSAELGNGIASFEIYEILRRTDNRDAAYFLEKAKKFGYPIAKDLPSQR